MTDQFGMNPEILAALRLIEEVIEAGDVKTANALIEQLDVDEGTKAALRAHAFVQLGMRPAAVSLLEEVLSAEIEVTFNSVVSLARIAFRAHGFGLVPIFLNSALNAAVDLGDVEAVLEAASDLNEIEIAQSIAHELISSDVKSRALTRYLVKKSLDEGNLREAAKHCDADNDEDRSYFRSLADKIEGYRPNYEAALADAKTDWPERTAQSLSLIVKYAARHGDSFYAFKIAFADLGDEPSEFEVVRIIQLMASTLLTERDAISDDVIWALAGTIDLATNRLAAHPTDNAVRAHLGSLLTAEESGLLGRAVLGVELQRRVDLPWEIDGRDPERDPPTKQQGQDFLAAVAAWTDRAEVITLGRSSCPPELVPPSFHAGVLWRMVADIDDGGAMLEQPGGYDAFLRYVAYCAGFSCHLEGPDRNLDIAAVKLAAEVLIRANRRQSARDIIEVVLQIAGNDPTRIRAAWLAYGAIHRSSGDLIEAGLATCAALGTAATIAPTEGWHETIDVIRLLRDLGNRQPALRLLERAASVLDRLNLTAEYGSRLETMRLQLIEPEVDKSDAACLEAFIDQALANASDVLAAEEDTAPVAMLLAQTSCHLPIEATHIKARVDETLVALVAKLTPQGVERVRRFSADPDTSDLEALASELGGARYGRNAVQDVASLVILARRYLSRPDISVEGAAFAIELLADQGLHSRDDGGMEEPGNLPTSPSTVLSIAAELARTGLSVSLLGLNSRNRLVRVDVTDKQTSAITEPVEVFSSSRLAIWRGDYPNRYAFIAEERDNRGAPLLPVQVFQAFENSVAGIGLSGLPPQRAVIIPDATLADIPFNLILCDGVFAGETRTIATAPSLSWLSAAAKRRSELRGPSACWVPTVGAPSDSLLPRIAQELDPILAPLGISINHSETMPSDLRNAELAIIAAHGGLSLAEGRFFRAVSDETRRVLSSGSLARGLSNSKIAILFVCHGARLDREPDGQATLGLARQILHHGCSAVVGSPWPLRGDVPVRWMPHFLEAWSEGLPIADAVQHANAKLGGFPDVRHALHVYGDPLASK